MSDVLPKVTRLRYVSAKKAEQVVKFVNSLGVRVQIYGAPTFAGGRWYLWFVPDDRRSDPLSNDRERLFIDL